MEKQTIISTDQELVACINRGDPMAFEHLVQRYEKKLFRIALRFSRNTSDAQDIVQIALLSVWKHLHAFEGRSQVGSWIHRVAMNTSLMFLRARGRQPGLCKLDRWGHPIDPDRSDLPELPGVYRPTTPDEHTRLVELHRLANRSLATLPSGLRRVFIIRVLDGHSTKNTARMLGLSQPAVKTRLHRARVHLRQEMQTGIV